jgi:hypothetical protein
MFFSPYYTPQYSPYDLALAQERALAHQQALQRARRAQYIPDDDDSSDDEGYYTMPQHLHPRELLYLEAKRRKQELERRRRSEALYQERSEAQRQEQLRREILLPRHRNSPDFEDVSLGIAFKTGCNINTHGTPQIRHERCQSRSPLSHQHVQSKPTSPTTSRSTSPSHSESASGTARAETTQTSSPPPVVSQYSQTPEEAATKIQNFYRVHHSLRTIKGLEHEFDELKATFVLPTTLDFQGPDQIITIAPDQPFSTPLDDTYTPKLAYTTINYNLHSYVESLNRLLIKLDGVESWGEAHVRKNRRRVVLRIETEASDVEQYWRKAWASHTLRAGQGDVRMEEAAENESQNADPAEVEPMAVESKEPPTPAIQGDLVAYPQLVPPEDDDETESEADFQGVEDIMTPEEEAEVPAVVIDLDVDETGGIYKALAAPLSKAGEELVREEDLEDFEMV